MNNTNFSSKTYTIFALSFFLLFQLFPNQSYSVKLSETLGLDQIIPIEIPKVDPSSSQPDLGDLITQLTLLNQNLTTVNSSWTSTNLALTDYTTLWQSTNNQLSQVTQNWNQTNQAIAKILDPAHAFTIGLAGGAGIAIGNAAIVAGTKALTTAFHKLHEWITQQERNQELIDAFEVAREEYKKASRVVKETEARLNSSIYILQRIHEVREQRKFVSNLNLLILELETLCASLKSVSTEMKKKIILEDWLDGPEPRRTSLSMESLEKRFFTHTLMTLDGFTSEVESNLRQAVRLRHSLESLSNDSLCDQMQSDISALIQAESSLQDARIILIDPLSQRLWNKAWEKQVHERLAYSHRIQDSSETQRDFKAQVKSAEKNFKEQLKLDTLLQEKLNTAWYACLSAQGSYFGSFPVLGHLFSCHVRSWCWEQVNNPESDYSPAEVRHLLSKASRTKAHSIQEVGLRQIRFNENEIPRFDVELNRYHRFFDRLRNDQSQTKLDQKLQSLLQKEERIESLCREY